MFNEFSASEFPAIYQITEILGKQNELFPSGAVIKCLIHYFDINHNTPSLPPKILHKYCFQVLLGGL